MLGVRAKEAFSCSVPTTLEATGSTSSLEIKLSVPVGRDPCEKPAY